MTLSVKKNGQPFALQPEQIVAELRTSLAEDSTLISALNIFVPSKGEVWLGLTATQTLDLLPTTTPKEQYTPAGVFYVAVSTEQETIVLLTGDATYQQTITRH